MRPTELAKKVIKKIPGLQRVRELQYRRRFGGDCYGCFYGVFSTFGEARAVAPKSKHLGFDHPDYPSHHLDRMRRLEPHDYPAILWLNSALAPGIKVFDFGGNVGVHYYAYSRYARYPPGLSWIVCDISGLVALGREIAAREKAAGLSFTESAAEAEGADVYLAAGVLQYVEDMCLSDTLAQMTTKPRHILLNKLPLYDGAPFVTLQNAGDIVTPQYVFNRTQFIGSMQRIGYRLVDGWETPGYSCVVPFHPERWVPLYSGLYFRRDEERL
jgi:putative methyltransferase (TIGR04325 family)